MGLPTRPSPPRQTELATPHRPWLWPVGIGAFLIALLVLGNSMAWLGRSRTGVPETFSPADAAVYVEVVALSADGDTIARLTRNGPPNEIQVTDARLIGTAKTDGGDIDLVAFAGTDDAGAAYSCLGTIDGLLTASTCAAEPSDEIQVFWSRTAPSTDAPFGNGTDLSVTVFDAPPEAVSMYVLLDSDRYVGADVVGGASHVVWQDQLGDVAQLVVVDAGGHELHRQDLEA